MDLGLRVFSGTRHHERDRDIAFQHAHTLGRFQPKPNFGAPSRSGRDSKGLPFILATFLLTLQPKTSGNQQQDAVHCFGPFYFGCRLQNSILGLWLGATQAGISPAILPTISSPHVQFDGSRLFAAVPIRRLRVHVVRRVHTSGSNRMISIRIPSGSASVKVMKSSFGGTTMRAE